jgi:hypothetical protein
MTGEYYAVDDYRAGMSHPAAPAVTDSEPRPLPSVPAGRHSVSPPSVEDSPARKWRYDPAALTLVEKSQLRRELRKAGMPREPDDDDAEDFAIEGMCIVAVLLARREDPTMRIEAWREIADLDAIEKIAPPDLEDPEDPTAAA